MRLYAMNKTFEVLSQAGLMFAAIFVTTALGIAVVRRYRDREDQSMEETSDLMSKFHDLHSQGGLSDEEFRTIKTKLANELKTMVKDG